MSRILARDCAFKMTFQYLFNKDFEVEKVFEEFDLTEEEKEFSLNFFCTIKNNYDDICEKISSSLKNNMKVSDLYKLDFAILLYTVCSIDYLNDSVALAINQAVEFAKKYSTDNSPKFVNGVLSTIYKK